MIHVGTSGWQYRDWRGRLYPERLPAREWLRWYASQFATVEVNNSFYRLPERSTFQSWAEQTPSDFVIAAKMSRYLTHVRRLRDPQEPVRRFLDHAGGLGSRHGPVLLQLPPTLRSDPGLLDDTLGCFPVHVRVALEVRHESWFSPAVCAVLEKRGAALCLADRRGRLLGRPWRTAPWGYVRFHEGTAQPLPSYGQAALRTWVERLRGLWPDGEEVFVYFNNDFGGCAVRDAVKLARLARSAGLSVSRTPDILPSL
jgi:uncharacterized protein YecE (DUF72 family)